MPNEKIIKTGILVIGVLVILTSSVAAQSILEIDSFEDNDLSEYRGGTSSFSTTTAESFDGSYSLTPITSEPIYSDSGLKNYPGPGTKITYRLYFTSRDFQSIMRFGVSDGTTNGWEVRVDDRFDDTIELTAPSGSGYTSTDTVDFSNHINTWMKVVVIYESDRAEAKLLDSNGNVLATVSGTGSSTSDSIGFGGASDFGFYIDNVQIEPRPSISGTVTDQDNKELPNAEITVKDNSGSTVATTTTNDVGDYTVSNLEDGTYTVIASKSEYTSESKTVTLDGSDVSEVDFKLTELTENIRFEVRNYIQHGDEAPYRVTITNNSGTYNVSNKATVTSNDTSVVSVDSTRLKLVATSDITVNERTFVEATYTDGEGNSYTTTQNVTVANESVENIGILPTGPRVGASFGDQTIQVILVAAMFGAAVAFLSRSFAGLGTMTLVMVLGWLGGMVGNGMVIISVLISLFIGLNIAANIDYTVTR